MIQFIETFLLFFLTILTAFVCGYGLVTLLWPKGQEEFRFAIPPCVGYPSLVLATHFVSGTFQIPVLLASAISFGALALLSLYAFWHGRDKALPLIRETGKVWLLSMPMIIVVLWPLFVVGGRTYLATVNPDFFMSLMDNEWLKSNPTNVFGISRDTNGFDPFNTLSGGIAPSARFGGAFFALLLEALFGLPQRTGLSLAIALFHFCMPLSLYVMVRIALGQSQTIALLSAVLLGVSSSITLGYLSYYVGQASGLGFLPLLIAVWFLCLTRPTFRIFLLAAILTTALWIMYTALVPYAGAPVLGLAIYLLVSKQLKVRTFLLIAAGSIGFLLFIHIRMLGMLVGALKAWTALVANALQGQYFVDFVTERFVPMFYGLTIYTLETSRMNAWLGTVPYLTVLFFLSACITAGLGFSFWHWMRSTRDRRHLVVGVSAVIAYSCVAINYVFVHLYGYGAFKNTIWLQFVLTFFTAFGLVWICQIISQPASLWKRTLVYFFMLFAALPMVAGNLFSSWEYGLIGLGKDTENGNMVVVHNMTGNNDYFELASAVQKIVKPHETVGLSFVNIAQQWWAMYYLKNFRISFLGQWQMPGDDENLPDLVTRRVVDAYGNAGFDSQLFFHKATDDYYLVNQSGVVNGEIVRNHYPQPLWQNSTFKLVKASDTPDFVFVGRGFYRSEYRKASNYYMPPAFKWTAEGGELYLLRASQAGRPYRLAFTGLTGPGLNSAERTIEFYHNKRKIGEPKKINGFGRIVSDPFYPQGDVDFLTFKIKEKVNPPGRKYALWHTDIPLEYRRLNVMVSDIQLIEPGKAVSNFKLNEPIRGEDLFTESYLFNGIEPNWWIRDEMSLSLVRPSDASEVTLSIEIPSQYVRYPYSVNLKVDRSERTYHFDHPGTFALTLPLSEKSTDSSMTHIQLKPGQTFTPDGETGNQRRLQMIRRLGVDRLSKIMEQVGEGRTRSLVYSVRLDQIVFHGSQARQVSLN